MSTQRFQFHRLAELLFSLAFLCAGCSHGKTSTASSAPPQRLFVTVAESASLLVYRNAAEGEQPMATIKENPADRPIDCSVNFIGEAYVANENGNVRVYGAGRDQKYKLIRSYEGPHTRLEHPVAITVNPAGSFYIADTGNGHGRVEWFSGGANEDIFPDKVLEGPHTGISEPRGVAIDGSGRTFVSDRGSNRILVFDPNARDDAAPLVILDGLHAPGRIAIDDLLNIYVVNAGDNTIAVLSSTGPESWAPGVTIASKLQGPGAIATNQAGQIAIGASDGIWFFATDVQREGDPLFSIHGGSPSVQPSGVCFH